MCERKSGQLEWTVDDGSERCAAEAIAGDIFSDMGHGCFGAARWDGKWEVESGLGLDAEDVYICIKTVGSDPTGWMSTNPKPKPKIDFYRKPNPYPTESHVRTRPRLVGLGRAHGWASNLLTPTLNQ